MIPEESLQHATEIARLALGPAGVDAKAGAEETLFIIDPDGSPLSQLLFEEAEKLRIPARGGPPPIGSANPVLQLKSPAIAGLAIQGHPDDFANGWPHRVATIPAPTTEWVDTRFDGDAARLWAAIHRAMRLDQPDAVAAWRERHDFLQGVMAKSMASLRKANRLNGDK